MKNNTVITAGDMNYVWGIAMLVASMRKSGMDEPVIVGGKNLSKDAVEMLERLGGVRVIPVDTARSLTCMKPEIMLAADTDYITWVDGDGFFTGNCSSRLIPERPDEIHIRKRTSRKSAGVPQLQLRGRRIHHSPPDTRSVAARLRQPLRASAHFAELLGVFSFGAQIGASVSPRLARQNERASSQRQHRRCRHAP